MIYVSPSILASDFSNLGSEAVMCEQSGADMLHIDVMDGHFVPNLTLGAPIIKSLRKCTPLLFDVHLMISDPITYIPDFAKAGADLITVHAESNGSTEEAIDLIRSFGLKAAVALKPATPVETVLPYLNKLYMVLIMTVEPGFGGQSFMPEQTEKIRLLKSYCKQNNLAMHIQVDGGINQETAREVIAAGADVLVAGSYIFKAQNKAQAVASLKAAGQAD